jgi:hypothetical protein
MALRELGADCAAWLAHGAKGADGRRAA